MKCKLPPDQNTLFCYFLLERHIPEDHLLLRIDQFLDCDQLHKHLQQYFYRHTGRSSIDPRLLIRILLIGHCDSIRFERLLFDQVNFDLPIAGFADLG